MARSKGSKNDAQRQAELDRLTAEQAKTLRKREEQLRLYEAEQKARKERLEAERKQQEARARKQAEEKRLAEEHRARQERQAEENKRKLERQAAQRREDQRKGKT